MTVRAAHACLLVLLLAHAVAAGASAATVDVVGGSDAVRYVAGAGERNELTFTPIEDSWPSAYLVSDPGATITAGTGCISVDAHSAACIATSGAMYQLRARLGDGDDTLHPAGFDLVRAEGGSGDDRLLGGTWDDRLDGGPGADELRGGEGADVLLEGDLDEGPVAADLVDGGSGEDWVSYEQRSGPVTVDLTDPGPDGAPGEGDVLLGIENVHGGRGDDRLVGDDGPNSFDDEGGTNQMTGGAGHDLFRGVRSGRVNCGEGREAIRGVTRRTLLDRSCESVLRSWFDGDFRVRAHPRRTAAGMTLVMWCDTYDGEELPCSGAVTISSRAGTLARGPIPRGPRRRAARLTLTPLGERLLKRRDVTAVVRLEGSGLPDIAWGVRLGE